MVVEEMKKLDGEGIGKFETISEKEKAFYKPLPKEENKDLLSAHANFTEYKENFKTGIDTKFMTPAQHNRLLMKSPHKDILQNEYGYKNLHVNAYSTLQLQYCVHVCLVL